MIFPLLAYACGCTFICFTSFYVCACIKSVLLYSFNQSTIIRTLSSFYLYISYYFYLFASIFFYKVLFIVPSICILLIFVVVLLSLSWCSLRRKNLFLLFISSLLLYCFIKSPILSILLSVFHIHIPFLLYSLNLLIPRPVHKSIWPELMVNTDDRIWQLPSSSTQTYLPNFGSSG